MFSIFKKAKKKTKSSYPHPDISVFRTTHHPYYIFSQEYAQNSAGDRVMYYLCHVLNDCGFEAYIVADKPVTGFRTPVLTQEIRQKHKEEKRHPIAVYNEMVQGNPLEGDIVVRWIMNKEVIVDGKQISYGADDLLFHWSEVFAKGNDFSMFRLPLIDLSIFNKKEADDSLRSGFCFYAHKYFQHKDGSVSLPKTLIENGTSLCQDIKRSHTEIADILRRTKLLLCYEPSSIMAEATLCGCPAVYIKTEYLSSFMLDQIYYGFHQITEDEIDVENIENMIDYDMFNNWNKSLVTSPVRTDDMVRKFAVKTQAAAQEYEKEINENDTLTSFCKQHSPIYIYGGGVIARQCFRVMKVMGHKIAGIVVSDDIENTDTIRETFKDVDVFFLSMLESQKENCGFVIAMAIENQDEVIKNLKDRKFPNYMRYSLLCPKIGKR